MDDYTKFKWISKKPPIYVAEGDVWYNEDERCIYWPDFQKKCWIYGDKEIPFSKKTVVFKPRAS